MLILPTSSVGRLLSTPKGFQRKLGAKPLLEFWFSANPSSYPEIHEALSRRESTVRVRFLYDAISLPNERDPLDYGLNP